MDKLKQCALEFQKLFNKDFYYTIEDGRVIKVYFAKKHFYHLIGLSKLNDIRPLILSSNNTATNIYNNIINDKISYNDIKVSAKFFNISERIDNFTNISDMLFDKVIIDFDKSKLHSTKLKSDIILFQDKGIYYLHLCLAKNVLVYYPETFLVQYDDYYIKNQNILKIKELKIVNIKNNIVERHNIYTDDISNIQQLRTLTHLERKVNSMSDTSNELLKKIEEGIMNAMVSERYKEFLKVQSLFHNYSFNNTMLIFLQRPDATRVAGYKTWQKLGRQVIKGEKGISILAPNKYKYEKIVDVIDPVTKEPVKDPDTGEVKKEKIEVEGLTFRKVTVFDIKQTEGKELPSICNELQGNSINAECVIKSIKQISEVPIIEKNINNGAKGYYNPGNNIIVLREGMSLDQTTKTLIHEYAHAILHNKNADLTLDRATKEVQAESVAYIVSNHFGIDTSEYSFEYLASWSRGKDLEELKNSFNIIQNTANDIINKIENVLTKDLGLQMNLDKPVELQGADMSENTQTVKDKIISQYSNEFPGIKYISESTAITIDSLNRKEGKFMTLDDIKNTYKEVGKKLERENSKVNLHEFKLLKSIVEDLKQAQLTERQAKAVGDIQTNLNKFSDLEITR